MPESKHRMRRGRRVGRGRSNDSLSLARPRRKKTNPWYLAASVTIAILVIGGFALGSVNLGGGSGRVSTGDSNQFEDGVGTFQTVMANSYPNPHVPEGEIVTYSTTPPTSGKHWDRWAQCGFYEDGLDDERITHNLEHGNIIVSYNLTLPEDVSRLRDVLDDIDFFPAWGLARFYDKIPEGQIALATWGVMDTMDEIDAERIQRFFDAYSGTLGTEVVDCRTAPFSMPE